MSEKIPKIKIEGGKTSNDMAQLKAEIEEKKTELLTKEGKELDSLELEIEMLGTQYNARKKTIE